MSKKAKIKNYYEGVREGITRYAHWKDGVQYVGTCGKTLKEALVIINTEEANVLDALEDQRVIKSSLGFSRVGKDAMRRR
jgi:hypothetical protein